MIIQNIINEIQDIVNSCNVSTNGVVITVSNPDAFIFSWRLDNKENIASSYCAKIKNAEEAEKVIKHFFPEDTDTINNLKKVNKFSEDEDLYLHLFLKV